MIEDIGDGWEREWIDTTPHGYVASPSGLLLVPEAMYKPPPTPIGVDLFCGAGGFSLGMEAAGFDVAVAVDFNPEAAFTYGWNLGAPGGSFVVQPERQEDWRRAVESERRRRRAEMKRGRSEIGLPPLPDEAPYFGANRDRTQPGPDLPGARAVVVGDVRELDAATLRTFGRLEGKQIDCVFGGPPCQGFSKAGKQDEADPRNNLVLEFLRLAIELETRTFIIENVPPLVSQDKYQPLFEEVRRRAAEAGFEVVANVVNAADYGVPQHRRRAIIIGTHPERTTRRTFQFPMPTHWPIGPGWNQLHDPEDEEQHDGQAEDEEPTLDGPGTQQALW